MLDYGCGYGDLTYAASRTHPDIVGIDVSPERVAFARSEYAPLPFEVCSEHGSGLADASFDVVLSIAVMPFVPDPPQHVKELARLLRPGGHVVIATKTNPPLSRMWEWLRRFMGRPPKPSLHHHSLSEAAALLEKTGFTVVRRTAFYDPPFHGCKNVGDVFNDVVAACGEFLGLKSPASYPVLLARRNAS